MSYSVPWELERLHDTPRRNWAFQSESNQFSPDFFGSSQGYYIGVITLSSAYWITGVVLFIIFAITLLVSLCTCSKKMKGNGNCCSSVISAIFSPRLWFLIFTLALLVGSAATLSQVPAFSDGINLATGALISISIVLSSNFIASNLGILLNLEDANTQATALATAAAAIVPPVDPTVTAAITALQTGIGTATSQAINFDQSINSTSASFSNIISGASFPLGYSLGNAGNLIATSLYVAVGVFMFWLIITNLGLLGTKGAPTYLRACNPCVTIALLLTFIVAGFLFGSSLIIADICVSPNDALISIANMTSANAETSNSIQYYAACGDNPSLPPTGAYGDLVNAQTEFTSSLSAISLFNDTVNADPTLVTLSPFIQQIYLDVASANSTASSIASTISCAPINSIYVSGVTGLCNTAGVDLVRLWIMSTLFCILMLLLTICGTRLCWQHPGDTKGKEDDAALAFASARLKMVTTSGKVTSYGSSTPSPASASSARAARVSQLKASKR
jgi:Tweety